MPTNKDVRQLMEARKARRAIPQTDPADVVYGPEPELAAQVQPEKPQSQPIAPSIPSHPTETPLVHHPQDSRYVPVPVGDTLIAKTYKFRSHRYKQLSDEKHFTGTEIQDILDTALAEYFEKRYGTPKDTGQYAD
jgi:hypothetical protein